MTRDAFMKKAMSAMETFSCALMMLIWFAIYIVLHPVKVATHIRDWLPRHPSPSVPTKEAQDAEN